MIETCPNCGANVPRGAKACPECGSCEETGWSEKAAHDHLGLPDDSFDYDEFVKEEFGSGPAQSRIKPRGIPWWAWAVAIAIIAALLRIFL